MGADDTIRADLRVGQNFSGSAYPYLPMAFTRFDLVQDADTAAVAGRLGDRPAVQVQAPGPGLMIIVHQTTDSSLLYDTPDMFRTFVEHKGFDGVLEAHAQRGLPEAGFRERYSRYAKSLIAVGNGQGADQEVGLLTEIIALANPYTDALPDGLPVQVMYEGAPRPDAQLEVFARDVQGAVSITLYRTDAQGRAQVAVAEGHEYLLDAVVMRPLAGGDDTAPVWESLWASLTFARPGQ